MTDISRNGAPLIGLTVEVLEPPVYSGRRRYQLFTDYLDCLREAGGVPLLLPSDASPQEREHWLEILDGILFTGGDDIDLRPLGGPEPPPECKPIPPAKQKFDLALVRTACRRKVPFFGVCMGMQMLGLAHEAPYIQHLPTSEGHEKGILHPVRAVPGTRLAALVGTGPFRVSSFHHQALGAPGSLAAGAWAQDGVLEAVERDDLPFALGVQWHPERLPESSETRALFSGFVQAALDYRRLRR
ncbi:MAG: gamma-glutamyl-gamma-aminobutyrate hydrolase family protein [Planctomycetota bacterium]